MKIIAQTYEADIQFGQKYTLPSDFTNGVVNNDPNAPKTGFLFQNKAASAAAVVFKKVRGEFAPIYMSQKAPLPPGTETLNQK